MKIIFSIFTVLCISVFSYSAPPVTQNLVLQLDASSVQTEQYSGKTVVNTWTDLAVIEGGSNDALQSNPAEMPEYIASSPIADSLPVLYFDGLDDELVVSDHDYLDPRNIGVTVFIVGKVDDMQQRYWLRKGNKSSVLEGYSIWSDDLERVVVRANAEGINDDAHKIGMWRDQQPGRDISIYKDLTVVTMSILGGDGSTMQGYVNGLDNEWNNWYGATYTGLIETPDNLLIGPGFHGYIAEVLIYKTQLSDTQRNSVINYLAAKYNLPLSEGSIVTDYYLTSDKEAYLANLSPQEQEKFDLGKTLGLLDFEPIHLPQPGEWLRPGWPVAIKQNGSICLFYRPYEMIRSTDNGQTWQPAVDMRDFILTPNTATVLAGMQVLGFNSSDQMVFLDKNGIYLSSDEGLSWQHITNAFTSMQMTGPALNNGPAIIQHPYWGLMTFPVSLDQFWIRYSQDGGLTWSETNTPLPASYAANAEAAAINYNDSIIMLSRCHDYNTYEPIRSDPNYGTIGTYKYVQLWSQNGQFPFQASLTNIKATGWGYGSGPWGQDTVDLSLNPVTQRLEAIVTNRLGGGPGEEGNMQIQTLNLWSIDPENLLAGSSTWTFEGTLLSRGQYIDGLRVEGMHPAGAVIDTQNNTQQIYVYLGLKNQVYGVYRITRSLDTDSLSSLLARSSFENCSYSEGFGSLYDLNEDCLVDILDLQMFINSWMDCYHPEDVACAGQ